MRTNGAFGRGPKRTRARKTRAEKREEALTRTPRTLDGRGAEIDLLQGASVLDLAQALHLWPEPFLEEAQARGLDAASGLELARQLNYRVTVLPDTTPTPEEIPTNSPTTSRPPVVAVLGHVDHGKTTLLDALRGTTTTEAGGITQRASASTVTHTGTPVTFLDTPGHQAFASMRSRGAELADVVVLVVALDDGVKPQTLESLEHTRESGCALVVALTKADAPGAHPARVRAELAGAGVLDEAYGGDTLMVEVSARTGLGLPDLLDAVVLVASATLDLRADPSAPAAGRVLDSWVDKGLGVCASVLVLTGTLARGDALVSGTSWGRLRTLSGDPAPSGVAVVTGLDSLPAPGQRFSVHPVKVARARANEAARHEERVSRARGTAPLRFGSTSATTLELVLKTVESSTLPVLAEMVRSIPLPADVRISVVRSSSGVLNDSDLVEGATLVHLGPLNAGDQARAVGQGLTVVTSEVIYRLEEEVAARALELSTPALEEEVTGTLEVVALFSSSRTGTIAGCRVRTGSVRRGAVVRVLRAGREVARSTVTSLQRERTVVSEVGTDLECGLTLTTQDLAVGDTIEVISERAIPQPLRTPA